MAGDARKISGLMNRVAARNRARDKLRNASGVGNKIEKGIDRDRFWDEARKTSKKMMARENAEDQMKNARIYNSGEDRDDEHRNAWRGIDQTGERNLRNKKISERTGARKTNKNNAAETKARKNAVSAMSRVDNEEYVARFQEHQKAMRAIRSEEDRRKKLEQQRKEKW